jgi:hypothetical protein
MDVNLATDLRNEVVKWINSKAKDLDKGFELMRKSGYKPHVFQNFIKNRHRHDIPLKLENQLRLFLRYYANPNNPIHQDEVHDFYQKNETPAENTQAGFTQDENLEFYPGLIKSCITQFRDLYTQRSKMHNQLKKIGEGNSKKETGERAVIMAKIEAASRRMDELWEYIDAYKKNGYLPSEESVNAGKLDLTTVKAKAQVEDTEKSNFVLASDVASLTKQSDGWRTKIVKAKNRLKYQTETRQEKQNPMPEGPKRIKLERRIERLIQEKLIIDTALAKIK